MEKSVLRDLVAGLELDEKRDLMYRATRACESYCGRRLAPFVGLTESHRAEGADPDELAEAGLTMPADVRTVIAGSYGTALGMGAAQWVRRCWVKQTPPLYEEMWSYSDVSITLYRSFGNSTEVPVGELIGGGIEPETGLLWFKLGTFLPPGSRVRVTYSGGYHTVPADLVEACRLMAAAAAVDEDDFPGTAPSTNSHTSGGGSDGGFLARAKELLAPYKRAS
jgi:hypothetical protein